MHSFKFVLGALLMPVLAATGVVSALPASAQTYGGGNPGVADVSVTNGGVVIVRGDSGAQVPAVVNAPVVPGDYIATSSGSSAEVQLDGSSMLRLAGNSQVRFVNLNANARDVQLGAGTIDVAELQGASGSPQVDTPTISVRPNGTGDTRISVLGDGRTLVTVRSGSATIITANGSQVLTPGSTLVADGSSIGTQAPIRFDSFDNFNVSRDQAVVSAYNASPYLSPQLAGFSNFANYGQWQNVPGYGYAWAPNDQSRTNFAPYQNGQWVWEPGYGYTWVDNAPYGYATSHYGSWFNNPNYGGWLWQPPASQYQDSSASLASAWLPAVVSFFLTGNNGGAGGGLENILGNLGGVGGLSSFLGNGNNADIGWIPLAPGEPYQPWYAQNYSYPPTSLSNVTNITNVYNYYGNARYYRAISTVPVSAWRDGDFHRRVAFRPQQLRQMVLIRGAVPLVPTTANLRCSRAFTVKHPVALSHAFTALRFAGKAPLARDIDFKEQQARVRSIAGARPRVVALAPHPVRAVHPVYRPAVRPPIRFAAIRPDVRPAARPVAHLQRTTVTPAHPAVRPRPAAAVAHNPIRPHRAIAPVVRPVAQHVARPAHLVRRATAMRRPAAPIAHVRPVAHGPVTPVARPVTAMRRPKAPVAHVLPVAHRPVAPVVRPATVVRRPEAPVARPVVRRPVVPAARPVTVVHRPVMPVVRPVVRPAPAPRPAPVVQRRVIPAVAHVVARPPAPPAARPAPRPAVRPARPAARPARPEARPSPKR